MSIYRIFKGLTLTAAGSVLIATSAIALNDLQNDVHGGQCALAGSVITTSPLD